MACQDCNQHIIPTVPINQGCPGCGSGCSDYPCVNGVIDTTCVVYTGPNLTCTDATTNTCLELILQKMDSQLCNVVGNYSGFNLHCLRAEYTINTPQQFAESVSDYVCSFREDYNEFVETIFVDYQEEVNDRFEAIETPGITSCAPVGIVPADPLNTVLGKLSIASCNLLAEIASIPTADWSLCYTVITPPTTLVGALNVLLSQICQASGGSTVLPTFDNTTSCLPAPLTSTDSLVSTINKIKTRLCQTPTFNAGNLNASTCIQFSGASTLEDVINAQNNMIDQVSQNSIRAVTSAFILTDIDPVQPCLGKSLALNSSVVDRLVAMNPGDPSPGTLFAKLAAGTNVTLDYGVLNAGRVTITATGGITTDEKVKATALDSTAGFLDAKIIGGSNFGITIDVNATVSNDQIEITPTLDLTAFINMIFDEIEDDEDLRARFCTIVASCPSPCDAPSNISVTYE